MLNHIKRYPLSLLVIFTVIYLSFFRPPEIDDEVCRVCCGGNFTVLIAMSEYQCGMLG